jgi:hypothetical protein
MNSPPARWALTHLDAWTWLVAEYRIWLIVILTAIGFAAPLLIASRKHRPRPAPSVVIGSAAMALGFSAATVTACSLLHFSDLRWLAPGHRATAHLSAPGGLFSFAKPIVAVVNSVAGVPAEFRAIEVSIHAAITRAPGSGCPFRGGPDLAPGPPRRHQADRAGRNTKISRRVRAETAIGSRDARNRQADTAPITQI